jgi:hypothetical protein
MAAASALVQSIGAAAANDFRAVMPDRAEFHVRVSEKMEGTVIERAWLDTTRPRFGETHTVHVLLRDYRGDTETVAIPVTMPAQAAGPLTLLVSDAPTLSALERRSSRG